MITGMSEKFRVKLLLNYDGGAYDGWQRQPHGVPTVQRTIEDALKRLFGAEVPVVGSSRTDSGVHAFGQVAHFDSPKDPTKFKDFVYSLQALLPDDIVVKAAWTMPSDFDASWDAESKIYRYVIYNAPRPTALQRHHSVWIRRPLNLDLLNEYSGFLVGKHDFSSFKNTGGTSKTTERHILSARWFHLKKNFVVFEVHGVGFLKQMVRNIVGTMLELEKGASNPLEFKRIIDARDRKEALTTAPPHGLYLMRIFYPKNLDKKCRKL